MRGFKMFARYLRMNMIYRLLFLFLIGPLYGWDAVKREILWGIPFYKGWCSEEKGALIIDLLRAQKPELSVDIGTYGGATLSVIAKTVALNQTGIVYTIDAWSNEEAVRGFQVGSRLYHWWLGEDFNWIYFQLRQQLNVDRIAKVCKLCRMSSAEALSLFADESIDFLHIDGNHSENGIFFDAFHYYPKVKYGGYILLNDANWISARKAVIYLLENCELCIPYHENMTYLLFKKTVEVKRVADQLWR